MEEFVQIDITQHSFDQFIDFMFDHKVVAKFDGEAAERTKDDEPWYWELIELVYDPKKVCGYYVRLFREPRFLLQRFPKPQLEQGFWAIQGPNLDCGLSNLLWVSELSFAAREECVRSMFDLFRLLFAAEPLDTSVQMWWDSLCYDWHCGNRNRALGGEDMKMQDVMFETLAAILCLDSPTCQGAALHGLGHLHHPETRQLIQRYLEEHPSLSTEWKQYALAAAEFKVM
jgi:hypothetical protein